MLEAISTVKLMNETTKCSDNLLIILRNKSETSAIFKSKRIIKGLYDFSVVNLNSLRHSDDFMRIYVLFSKYIEDLVFIFGYR